MAAVRWEWPKGDIGSSISGFPFWDGFITDFQLFCKLLLCHSLFFSQLQNQLSNFYIIHLMTSYKYRGGKCLVLWAKNKTWSGCTMHTRSWNIDWPIWVSFPFLFAAAKSTVQFLHYPFNDFLSICQSTIILPNGITPDVSLWENLSTVLGADILKLLQGELHPNRPKIQITGTSDQR